jgi:hypothetical protein
MTPHSKGPVAGITPKAGQYLEEPARLTWTTHKPTMPGLYGYRTLRDGKAYVGEVELAGDTLNVDEKKHYALWGPVMTIEWLPNTILATSFHPSSYLGGSSGPCPFAQNEHGFHQVTHKMGNWTT